MWTLMAAAAACSIVLGLIAFGLAIWHDDESNGQDQQQI
jgi:hypothetical protein